MPSQVIYEDLGLSTLGQDLEREVVQALEAAAMRVNAEMRMNIVARGFVDTGATANSVMVDAPAPLVRDIGPGTEYAIYGELGYIQTHAWGHKLKQAIFHPGLHFARDALAAVKGPFEAMLIAAGQRLGGK